MTFRDEQGKPLVRIQLQQVLGEDGLHGRLFQLAEGFSYVDDDGSVHPVARHDTTRSPVTWIDGVAHITNGTDLASVPTEFWALIASYGRQSPAAIMHDQQANEAGRIEDPAARVAARVPIDLRFTRALRSQGVPRLRAHLMWAFVSLQSHFAPMPGRSRAIIAGVALASIAVWVLIVGLIVAPSPWWLVLLALPVLLMAVFWRTRMLVGTLLATGVLLGWLMLLQLLLVCVFRLVERVSSPGESVSEPTVAKYRIR